MKKNLKQDVLPSVPSDNRLEFARYWNAELGGYSTEQIIDWAVEMFHPRLAVGVSSGLSCSVLTAMLSRVKADLNVYYTGGDVQHVETLEYLARLEKFYGRKIIPIHGTKKQELTPNTEAVYRWSAKDDEPIFSFALGSRQAKQFNGWICGARLERSPSAIRVPFLEWDDHFGLFRIAPLARWNRSSLWNMIRKESIPYNPLYEELYEKMESISSRTWSYTASRIPSRRYSSSG